MKERKKTTRKKETNWGRKKDNNRAQSLLSPTHASIPNKQPFQSQCVLLMITLSLIFKDCYSSVLKFYLDWTPSLPPPTHYEIPGSSSSRSMIDKGWNISLFRHVVVYFRGLQNHAVDTKVDTKRDRFHPLMIDATSSV